MEDEKEKPRRGLQRRFPTHLTITAKETGPGGEAVYEVEFMVRPPRLQEIASLTYFQKPYDVEIKLGLEVITDVRQGDLCTPDGDPIHAGVEGWREKLTETYPDLVAAVGAQYAHLITGHRLKARDPDFFPTPEPTSPNGSDHAPSAGSAPASTGNGQGPTAKS